MYKNKKIVALIGGSGTGKTTIGKGLEKHGLVQIVSHTTRAPRVGEVEGIDYYYIDKTKFDTLDKIESVEYNGNYYCFSREEVDSKLAQYDLLYVVIDIHGYEQLKAVYNEIVEGFYIYISLDEMKKRMIARGDSIENVESRIQHAININELDNGKYLKHHIENIDLEKSIQQVLNIVKK